jgi:hypothetical protein
MTQLPPFLDLPPHTEEAPPKSQKLAVVLATLFGPFGLFYASPVGGLFMTFVCAVVGVGTVGVGLLLAWPVCIFWAYVATAHEPTR